MRARPGVAVATARSNGYTLSAQSVDDLLRIRELVGRIIGVLHLLVINKLRPGPTNVATQHMSHNMLQHSTALIRVSLASSRGPQAAVGSNQFSSAPERQRTVIARESMRQFWPASATHFRRLCELAHMQSNALRNTWGPSGC